MLFVLIKIVYVTHTRIVDTLLYYLKLFMFFPTIVNLVKPKNQFPASEIRRFPASVLNVYNIKLNSLGLTKQDIKKNI